MPLPNNGQVLMLIHCNTNTNTKPKYMLNRLLNLFGYEVGRNSYLFFHMEHFTNSSWLTDLNNSGRIEIYKLKK